jgi:hypothetical protein
MRPLGDQSSRGDVDRDEYRTSNEDRSGRGDERGSTRSGYERGAGERAERVDTAVESLGRWIRGANADSEAEQRLWDGWAALALDWYADRARDRIVLREIVRGRSNSVRNEVLPQRPVDGGRLGIEVGGLAVWYATYIEWPRWSANSRA